MKKLVLAFSVLVACGARPALAADSLKIDPSVKDADGIPMCPAVVTQTTAFAIFGPAMKQAKSWHAPSKQEIAQTRSMIKAFKDHDYVQMLKSADDVGLQTCRVIEGDDKYILFLTKYGKSNYNGTFFILRDAAKVSKITVIAPHVLTDNYHNNAPAGVQRTHARALIQNGYHKGLGGGRVSDFSHTKDNLGFWAVKALNENFPRQLVLHIHGMKNPSAVLRRPTDSQVIKAFDKAIREHTNITNFQPFNAFYEIDPPNSTAPGLYVKTEIPVRVYLNNINIVASIVTEFEKLPIAWDDAPNVVIEPESYEVMEGGDDTGEAEVDDAQPLALASPVPGPWMPPRKPRLGKQDLICVAVQYTSGPSADEGRCRGLAGSVSAFYDRMSNGKMHLVPKAISLPFDGPAGGASAGKAHDIVRKKYPNALFLFPNLWYKGSSHAGMRVAVLTGYSNANHEVGHLLGLGHCGAYKADGTFDGYGGGGCIMSKFFGNAFLAPSQFIYEGWYDQSQYAVQQTAAPAQYELRPISALKAPGLAAVAIPPSLLSDGRPGFIGWPPNCENDPCLAFYYATGGGSQRVKIFGKEFFDEKTGLRIKQVGSSPGKVKIEVSVTK